MFCVFLEKTDIKVKQNYIFNPVINIFGLQNFNRENLQ